MKVYVTDHSALWFWRHCSATRRLFAECPEAALSDCPSSAADLAKCCIDRMLFGPSKIKLMVPSTVMRFSRHAYDYRVHANELSPSAFCILNEATCVASPEYCCMQAAQKLSLVQTAELCMEFTGFYALSPDIARGFVDRCYPLTSVENLTRFALEMKGEYGAEKLLASLKYVKENSRSPMETRGCLLMHMPIRLGSYGIKGMQLNARIELSPEERRAAKRNYVECDMYWPEFDLVVEYDGSQGHSSFDQRSRDATKRNALLGQGKKVICVTAREILDANAFDAIVREIAKLTKQKLRRFPPDWTARRAVLRKELFTTMQRPN